MRAELSARSSFTLEVKRFRSAAEALQRQDYFQDSPFDPGQPVLLIWQSPRALLAAPGDARLPDFDKRARICTESGWPVAVRRGGGAVCPVSQGTLQLAISRPVSSGVTIDTAYEEMAGLVEALLCRFGLSSELGTCTNAFCPGRYDISVAGRKLAGLAQAWRRHGGEMTAITGVSIIVDEGAADLAEAANLFYDGLERASVCRSAAIGSIREMTGQLLTADDVLRELKDLV